MINGNPTSAFPAQPGCLNEWDYVQLGHGDRLRPKCLAQSFESLSMRGQADAFAAMSRTSHLASTEFTSLLRL